MDEPPFLHQRTIERYSKAQLDLFPPVSQLGRDEAKILFTVEDADQAAAAGEVALVSSAYRAKY
eukprot:SAG11_NODE_8656_length_990_cov_2.142536_1_plen_64_part_00